MESELWIARRRGLSVLWRLPKTRPPPVPRHGNATLPHLLLCQRQERHTLNTEVELSVCEGASQRTNTTCVREIIYIPTCERALRAWQCCICLSTSFIKVMARRLSDCTKLSQLFFQFTPTTSLKFK